MKSINSSSILLLIVCALLVANPDQTYAGERTNAVGTNTPEGGRLIIKRSPVLPYDIPMVIYIDGHVAGPNVWPRTFDTYIAPGRHVVVASPNQLRGDWRGIVDVRPGQTHTYLARYNVNRLVLDPIYPCRPRR